MQDHSNHPDGQRPDDTTPATEAPETMQPRPEPTRPAPSAEMPSNTTPDEDAPTLTVDTNTVAWIIVKSRELDVKEPASADTDDDDGHNPLGVLEDRDDDPTMAELESWISDLDDNSQAEVIALMWLGRADDEDASTFPELLQEARRRHAETRGTVSYLLGTPRLGDYLEEGLEKLGVDTANLEGGLR